MRVLIVALAFGGCYRPSIEDCQFACDNGTECPDGTMCRNNLCRSASGNCKVTADARVDATDPCPFAQGPPPNNCTNKFAIDATTCGVLCESQEMDWNAALAACGPAWQLAVLHTQERLDAVPDTEEVYWVGARRTLPTDPWLWIDAAAMPVAPAAWSGGVEPLPSVGSDCATINSSNNRLNNLRGCNSTERYICTFPPL